MLMPVHPGRILASEIEARGLTPHALALKLRVPANRIGAIIAGTRGISADTALRLGHYLGTGPELWMRLQADYDLALAEKTSGPKVRDEVNVAA
ncbi:MAG: HigA family addiction module antitoxin [Rhodospirillales bacterium]|nr:HigA family addiction module antitoxin [Rhodospirillales bacterium]